MKQQEKAKEELLELSKQPKMLTKSKAMLKGAAIDNLNKYFSSVLTGRKKPSEGVKIPARTIGPQLF